MDKLIRFPNVDLNDPEGEFIPVVAKNKGDDTYQMETSSKVPLTSSVVSFTAATSGSGTYAANDAVHASGSTPFQFANIVPVAGDSGYIMKARLMVSGSAITAQFRLHLYTAAPTVIADNSPFTLLWANNANRIGSVDFGALSTEGAGSDCAKAILTPGNGNLPLPFKCAAGSTSIYALLETLGALSPTATLQYYIELMTECS